MKHSSSIPIKNNIKKFTITKKQKKKYEKIFKSPASSAKKD